MAPGVEHHSRGGDGAGQTAAPGLVDADLEGAGAVVALEHGGKVGRTDIPPMRVRHILLVLAAAALLYLFALPSARPFESHVVEPARELPAGLAADDRLDGLRRFTTIGDGPEDVAVDADGHLYTGTAEGNLWTLAPGADEWRPITVTYGRPLGLAFGPADRWLYIADGRQGLMRTDKQGHLELIADEFEGQPLGLVDDLDVSPAGVVYFTSATTAWDYDDYEGALLAHDRSGRLYAYDTNTRTLTVVLDGLAFPNGVAVAPDGSAVYVASTADYSVLRVPLDGDGAARAERFAERLPGFPDGLNFDDGGRLWVSLVSPRNTTLDALANRPLLRRAVYRLPEGFKPRTKYATALVALGRDGAVVDYLSVSGDTQAPYAGITNGVWRGDTLYVGSLVERSVGWVVVE